MTSTRNATLYYCAGGSNKIYQAALEPSGTGFVVNFAYGRRGSTMTTGCKTPVPVDYAAASKIFDKLIHAKTAKGYSPGESGTPYQGTTCESQSTGVLPQLLNPIDEDEAQKLIADPAWLAQEKFDGRRVLIQRRDTQITGINRRGLIIALPQPIVAHALTLGSEQWLLDGEAIGEKFHAFDLLENACVDLRQQPCARRLVAMHELLATVGDGPIVPVPTARTPAAKRSLLAQLRQEGREGIVFKRADSLYVPGRPASGGDQRKLKFTATVSCIVAGANGGRRSVALELLDGTSRIAVGNVTIPPRTEIPSTGQVIEVRCLYAYPGGSLYQPVYLGVRSDILPADCTVGQLKFKSADQDEEA